MSLCSKVLPSKCKMVHCLADKWCCENVLDMRNCQKYIVSDNKGAISMTLTFVLEL